VTQRPPKFESTIEADGFAAESVHHSHPSIVRDLRPLVDGGAKFGTVYADPPWPYSNTAARGAAENHYRTMAIDAICSEPVKELVAEQAHLHLWTTNAFCGRHSM
jgi:hypothetical protein